jgi:hypothetical protein
MNKDHYRNHVAALFVVSCLGLACTNASTPTVPVRSGPQSKHPSHTRSGPPRSSAVEKAGDAEGRWISEAREALGAIVTGEQAYLQHWASFSDARDVEELWSRLGVDVFDFSRRWSFSVHDATAAGFIAEARGRNHAPARGIVVTLTYRRDGSTSLQVQRRRRP